MHKEGLVTWASANLQSAQLLLRYKRHCGVDFASSSSLFEYISALAYRSPFQRWHVKEDGVGGSIQAAWRGECMGQVQTFARRCSQQQQGHLLHASKTGVVNVHMCLSK
jgi:hypothetical protein